MWKRQARARNGKVVDEMAAQTKVFANAAGLAWVVMLTVTVTVTVNYEFVPRCLSAFYCSETCSHMDWPNHRSACSKVVMFLFLSTHQIFLNFYGKNGKTRVSSAHLRFWSDETDFLPLLCWYSETWHAILLWVIPIMQNNIITLNISIFPGETTKMQKSFPSGGGLSARKCLFYI